MWKDKEMIQHLTNDCRREFIKWCTVRGFIVNWRRADGTIYEAKGLWRKYEIWKAAWDLRSEYRDNDK